MDLVLVHDAWMLPVDVYQPLQDAGHRVASHGAELPALGDFLDAMQWKPRAFVVDFRGRHEQAAEAAAWLRATAPWNRLPAFLVNLPEDAEALTDALDGAPGAEPVGGVDDVLARLERL